MRTRVIGKAGRYSTKQAQESWLQSAKWELLAVLFWIGAGFCLYYILRDLTDGVPMFALLGGVASVGLALWSRSKGQPAKQVAQRQQRGTNAEDEVVAALKRARVSLVMNGVDVQAGGDADHVVAHLRGRGQGVLAVVETKAGGGEVLQNGRYGLLSGRNRRVIPGKPIEQVLRQKRGLERLTGRNVVAIVCVPGMKNKPFTVEGVVVGGVKDLRTLFASQLPATSLTAADLDKLISGLKLMD